MEESIKQVVTLPVESLRPGRYQPRKNFKQDALQELADSIRQHGLMQPIVVYPVGSSYEILAGERRWRAVQLAGLHEIPAIIREGLSDEAIQVLTLIENLQREDLNPVEEAQSMLRLKQEFALSVEEIAKTLGKARPTVSNALRLLELDSEILGWVENESLKEGHAKALLAAPKEHRRSLALECIQDKVTVRQVEAKAKQLRGSHEDVDVQLSRHIARLEEHVSQTVGQPTSIATKNKTGSKGVLSLKFSSHEELEGLLSRLGVSLDD